MFRPSRPNPSLIGPALITASLALAFALISVGCNRDVAADLTPEADRLDGTVSVDGSSTVFPITEAVAEEFRSVQPRVRVTVGVSGTGGGFKKFNVGETDINDASRPIKESERTLASENGVEYIELPIAYDGLSVVVNIDNDWVDYLTVDELHQIWKPDSTVTRWSDVRSSWPAEPIALYAPGTDSGTFDYFTEAVNGKGGVCRSDFTASEDDNVIVSGVAGDKNALGFFGFAYYAENKDTLKVVPIDNGSGPVEPTTVTINNGTYAPLSRPIFIYLNKAALARPEVESFVDFYLEQVPTLAAEVGYVALPDSLMRVVRERLDARAVGSVYPDAPAGASLEELFASR